MTIDFPEAASGFARSGIETTLWQTGGPDESIFKSLDSVGKDLEGRLLEALLHDIPPQPAERVNRSQISRRLLAKVGMHSHNRGPKLGWKWAAGLIGAAATIALPVPPHSSDRVDQHFQIG